MHHEILYDFPMQMKRMTTKDFFWIVNKYARYCQTMRTEWVIDLQPERYKTIHKSYFLLLWSDDRDLAL